MSTKQQQHSIELGTAGIRRALRKYDAASSIAEFVWNGFDAGARSVAINYEANDLGGIDSVEIVDDGSGIPLAQLKQKFKPFLHSNKVFNPDETLYGPSAKHGKNGIGRLTFFHFASKAAWATKYQRAARDFYQYAIEVHASTLNKFSATPETVATGPTGTAVQFYGIYDLTVDGFDEIVDYLTQEFAWFIELQSPYPRSITICGEKLDLRPIIADRQSRSINIAGEHFDLRYIRWKRRLHNEYSRYYFVDSEGRERAKQPTSFNNKGDDFFHSVFLKSTHFDTLLEPPIIEFPEDDQLQLPTAFERDEVLRDLIKYLHEFLRSKRTPFLRKRAATFITELEEEKAFPEFGVELWDRQRKKELSGVVRELYEVEPRIFSNLNIQQKQTLLQLFSLVMDSSEREQLLDVISHVVTLDQKQRTELARILKNTRLSNVISTIKLIEDRFVAVDQLKQMVFVPEFGANERDHLQTHIERHYWLFGEQYHLVSAAEATFEAALRKYLYVLRGERSRKGIDHPDKNRQMDVFAVRWLYQVNQIDNVVLELKHPTVVLGSKELQQVKDYMNIILKEPQFNAANMTWDFYLVGRNYDEYIEHEIENAKGHGEKHLVYKVTNYRIYVLNWSEVITNFELTHRFLLEKLELERTQLASVEESADEVLIHGHESSAIPPSPKAPLIAH